MTEQSSESKEFVIEVTNKRGVKHAVQIFQPASGDEQYVTMVGAQHYLGMSKYGSEMMIQKYENEGLLDRFTFPGQGHRVYVSRKGLDKIIADMNKPTPIKRRQQEE